MTEDKKKDESLQKIGTTLGIVGLVLYGIWALFGLTAFVTSLVCMGRSGDINDKTIGFVMAIFLGPLMFIYLWLNKRYCRSKNKNII